MKKKSHIVSIAAGLVLLLSGAVLVYYFTQRVSYSEEISGDPSSEISIIRNRNGIPVIRSETMSDACYALGFLHAKDRLPIMEYYRHIADGRISSLIGKQGIPLDRLSVAVGFVSRAGEIGQKLDQPAREQIESYVRGVNLYRSRQRYESGYSRDWSVPDVIAILLVKEWSNAFLNNREIIFPVLEGPKAGKLRAAVPGNLFYTYSDENRYNLDAVKNIRSLVEKYMGTFNRGFSFHVPPQRTKNGAPLTGFSFENELKLYPGWYPVHVRVRDMTLRGVTFTGMPFMFCGTNGTVTFSTFNCDADTQELVLEKVRVLDDNIQYLSGTGWKDFEKIFMPATDGSSSPGPVRATANGPVLNDITAFSSTRTALVSLRFFLPDESLINAFFRVPLSDSVFSARRLVAGIRSLPRTWLFSSRDASISAYSGRLHLQTARSTVFNRSLQGPSRYADISGFYRLNTQNFVSTGSFFSADAPYILRQYLISDEARADNIKNMVMHSIDITGEMVTDLLENTVSPHATEFVPEFITTLVNNPVTSARLTRIYLHNWTRAMDPGMVAPSIFQSVLYHYIEETLKDEFPDDIEHFMQNSHLMVPQFYAMVRAGRSPLFDDSSTDNIETREMIFDRAFLRAMRLLNRMQGPVMDEWKWGAFHRGHFLIPLHETSVISRTFHRIQDMTFAGGDSSIIHSLTDRTLRPVSVTSIAGYFSDKDAQIRMNFSYSVMPMSEFYYGKADSFGFTPFYETGEKYLTRIFPRAR